MWYINSYFRLELNNLNLGIIIVIGKNTKSLIGPIIIRN
jgi:hypothetical protein